MGCDIHLFTEKKRTVNNAQRWVNIDNWKLNPYYDKDNPDEGDEYEVNSAYRGRDYALFSMLADVRNNDGNAIISEPKGLPNDVSEIVRKESDRWDGDGHSHSFFTMKELYDFYEKNKTVKYSGLVDSKGLESIKNGEMPNWWCESSSLPLTRAEWEHENKVIKNFIYKLEIHFSSEYFRKENDSKDFRIVFWFNN